MTTVLSPLPIQKFFDNNGRPMVGGLLFTYAAGTTTKIATYKDQAGTLNTNPVVLDYRGEANVWLDQTLAYKFVLAPSNDTDPPTHPIWSVDNISAGITFASLTRQIIGMIFYPQSPQEAAALITPVNYYYFYGVPERYGAVGDGVTSDQTPMVNCFAANDEIHLTPGKTYLISGITITTIGKKVYGTGGGNNSYLKVSGAAGSFGLKFISPSGAGTHFSSGFYGRDFNISCAATANQVYGIWCANAEITSLINVVIDLTGNTFAGVARNATYAFLGTFQQDGTFIQCTFCSGLGANADGVYLASIGALALPNSNLFLNCRAQSNGGYGVRQERGVGNMWIGGKFQANKLGGWIEADDGTGAGGVGTCIYGAGFEHNGNAGAGYDLYIELGRKLALRDCSFQSLHTENQYGINVVFGQQCIFENNFSYDANPVNLAGGVDNIWNPRTNNGFGTVSITAGVVRIPTGVSVKNSVAQSTANNAFVTLTFDTENYDSNALHSTVTNPSRLTADSFGLWMVVVSVRWTANAVGIRTAQVLLNGTTVVASFDTAGASAVNPNDAQISGNRVIQLNAGDYIELQTFQNSGGALNVQPGDPTTFQMVRVPE